MYLDNLFTAIELGNLNDVKSILGERNDLINKSKVILNQKEYHSHTPLFEAVLCGNRLEIVKFLVSVGADIDKADDQGWTPLFLAVNLGQKDIVHCLLEHGAQLDKPDKYGNTPIHSTPFHNASKIIQDLLLFGDDINRKNHNGETPLMNAVRANKLDTVKFLLNFGADIDMTNNRGDTPLQIAKNHKLEDMVKLLKDKEKLARLKENFNSGVWINDPELIKLLPSQLFHQVNVLAQLSNIHFINFPIELFHDLLLELWYII